MNRRRATFLFGLICVILICVLLPTAVLAESAKDPEAEIMVAPGENIPNGIDIKMQLRDKGYYSPNVPDDVFNNNALDDHTMNALGKLADTYPDRPAYNGWNRGMTEKALWDLQNQSQFIKSIAESAVGYTDITPNGTDQPKVIEAMQKRLKELNYLSMNDANYKPGELSPALFSALEAFLKRNGAPELYDPQVISAAVQEKLLDTSPDLLVAAERKSFPEKLRAYFTGSRRLLGLNIPVLALWFLGIVLVAACVVVFINTFKPEADGGSTGKGSSTQSRRYHGKPVKFEIDYHSQVTTHEQPIEGFLKIGRNVGDFPLNLDDTSVSRRHCELFYEDKKLMLKDYSRDGTWVNDELVHNTQRRVNSGDTLSIGEHKIKLKF